MKYKFKFCLVLLLLILTIGAVSASENMQAEDGVNPDISINPIASKEYVITDSNYDTYFDDDGKMLSTISNGDTLKLSGKFNEKTFILNKNVTVVGDNAEINQGTIVLITGASGSTVSNLKIINNGQNIQGFFLADVTNCVIKNNDVFSCGQSSFPIALNPGANYNTITGNILKSSGASLEGTTKATCDIVLGGAHYNTISNNYLEVDDANAIYLSTYGSGSFLGGKSNNNVIFNNTIKCMVVPTSWCYGIQMMGSNNKAESNTIIGTYRGISGEDGSIIINNNLVNLTGKNYATGELVGGDYAIIAGANSVIKNNTLTNCLLESAGIYVADNGIVEDNNVDVKGKAYGIEANGNDVKIIKNIVKTNTGACIYQAGKLSKLLVNNNTLTSNSGVGVLVKKTSSSKIPSAITITNNVISTSNEYAINAKDANKTNYEIKDNKVGSSKILSPDGEIEPEPDFNFDGTVFNIDPDNYHAFFDDNGNLINVQVKDGDILNFTGVFENINPKISLSLKITGVNNLFKNTEFRITSDSVWIENLTIRNTNSSILNTWGIFAENIKNIMIVNNDIFVYDSNAAYAIYLNAVNKVTIKDNNLSSSGDYLTYPVLLYGVENGVVENNNILANGTGQIHGYEPSKCIDGEKCLDGDKCLDGSHIVKEIFRTYGILLITSSQIQVVSNDVVVTSKLNQSQAKVNGSLATNSIVGIDTYFDSNNNVFDKNIVLVYGNDNYMYGMGILGAETNSGSSQYSENNKFTNNVITVRGENMGTGIISGYHTQNNEFIGNSIDVVANNSAYGITMEFGKTSKIKDNNISLSSDIAYGIEMFEGDENVISENIINTTGAYGFGIGGHTSNNNNISSNQINVNSSSDKQISPGKHTDALGFGNAGVIFMVSSTGNIIENNRIVSNKNYAVNITGTSNNKVVNNYLKGESTRGNEAVLGAANNTVENNYGYEFTNTSLANSNIIYLGNATLVANSGIKDDKTTVRFYVNGKYVGNATTDSNGVATLTVKIEEKVGNYDVVAEFIRANYDSVNATAKLTVSKGNMSVDVSSVSGKKGTAVLLKATVKDTLKNPIKGIEVLFYRGSNYVGKATTDENGVATLKWTIPATLSGNSDSLKATVSGNDNYNGGEESATITYTNITQTQIVVGNVVKYFKNGTNLIGTLTDLNGNPIANTKVAIEINKIPYTRTTNKDGKFNMTLNIAPGDYEVVTKFVGNDNYYASNTTSTIKVLNVLKGEDTTLFFKNGTSYTVYLIDGQGKPLDGVKVKFNINGQFYERTTKNGGAAALPINLPAKTYVITAEYNGALISNNVTVYPILVDNKNIDKYYKNDTQYSVKLLDGKGNALSGVKVLFNINGQFYNRTTNANGTATMQINLPPGEYVITAMYNTFAVSNTVNVLNVVSTEDVTMTTASRVPFNIKILDNVGKPLAGAKIRLNINGVFYNRTTDSNGLANLPINLPAGKYIITTIYNNLQVGNNVTVTQV